MQLIDEENLNAIRQKLELQRMDREKARQEEEAQRRERERSIKNMGADYALKQANVNALNLTDYESVKYSFDWEAIREEYGNEAVCRGFAIGYNERLIELAKLLGINRSVNPMTYMGDFGLPNEKIWVKVK